MLEWHARAVQGAGFDTWLRGRFLEEWADPRAVQALSKAFAHYQAKDIWRALSATMDLFRWVSQETAQKLGFPYAQEGVEYASQLVNRFAKKAET